MSDCPVPAPRRSLYELLLLSDFARGNPERARELLDRCADPLTESRNEVACEERHVKVA